MTEVLGFIRRSIVARFLASAVIGLITGAVFVGIVWLLVQAFLVIT